MAFGKLGGMGRGFGSLGSLGRSSTPLPVVSGFYNFTGSNLPNWTAALAAKQAGTANAVMAALGDSTSAGAGSTAGAGGGVLNNAKSLGWPTQLAGLVSGGSWSSQWGDNNVSVPGGASAIIAYDTRLTIANWVIDTNGTIAGFMLREASALTGAFAFTPTNQIDTIEVWYAKNVSTGSFTIDVDGGAPLATVNTIGAAGLARQVVTTTLGNHTINLKRSAGGTVFEVAMIAYNSAAKEVSIYNMGAYGWNSANFIDTTNPWSALNVLTAVAPKLVIFEAGIINDWNAGTTRATVTANQTTVINAIKAAGGDVILMSGAPSNPATKASLVTQGLYVADQKALAYSLNVPFINAWELFGGGFHGAWMNDDLHPNSTGYAQKAGYVNTALPAAFRAA